MTAKEFVIENYPEFLNDKAFGGIDSCTQTLLRAFHLKELCENNKKSICRETCTACWNQEIPDEPQEQPTDTPTPTQPQILDSGNREEDTRKKILEDAIYCVCTDRKQQYGKPENSFAAIADFWSMYIRHKYDINIALTAADASMMLALFKIARGVTATKQKLDTYVDICGYAACAGELNCKEEK